MESTDNGFSCRPKILLGRCKAISFLPASLHYYCFYILILPTGLHCCLCYSEFTEMKFEKWMNVIGDQSFRGECPHEDYVLSSFIAHVRRVYPTTYGLLAFHPKNEGKRTRVQSSVDKMKGMTKGVCDVIIVGNPVLCLEIKRSDHTKSRWSGQEQIDFLKAASDSGAYVAVALGYEACLETLDKWLRLQNANFV